MTGFKDFDVAELLPHSGQMVWLDRITAFDHNTLAAELTVRDSLGLSGDHKTVPAWIGIEYMAQAVAAYTGFKLKLAGKPIRLGFLLGTRHYSSNTGEFAVGAKLTVHVEKIIQDEQVGVFDCRILGDKIEVTDKLNVYQPTISNM